MLVSVLSYVIFNGKRQIYDSLQLYFEADWLFQLCDVCCVCIFLKYKFTTKEIVSALFNFTYKTSIQPKIPFVD